MISSGNFQHIAVRIAAPQEFREQIGIARHIFETLRHQPRRRVIEIGPNADVVNAGDFTDVIDVIRDVGNGAARGGVGFAPIGYRLL